MKTIYSLIIVLIVLLFSSCTNNKELLLKYDFSKANSQSEMDSLLVKIGKENKDFDLDTVSFFRLNEIEIDGMHYDGVPVKKALLSDSYTFLTTDTINYYGKKLLEVIEAKKGLINSENTYNDDIQFIWKAEREDLDFKLNLVNGKHLAAIGDKDFGELKITFKPIYDVPLANIHKKIKVYDVKPTYVLNIRSYSNKYTVILDDIVIAENSKYTEHNLNRYITDGESSKLKIIVVPIDNSKFDKNGTFAATIYDETTKQTIADVQRISIAGKSSVEFTLDFTPKLPWYPKAWNNGVDLRKDENLKQKVNTLYKRVGDAILSKDEKAINDLFYQKQFEKQQLDQDVDFEVARTYWESLKQIQNNSYKYTIEDTYSIEFNANGRLIWTYPTNKTDMIIFTGKEFSKQMNFYLYQPEGSNELKIIR
ncbi:hypothetical protein [uncultured Aquimarina sp.]|uniref:hypothetical protein n=1 Tax=uncultured Aquimarina sp. TaxID=575652 RepID=UPI002603B96C|nr:hypothetical protein [uncultured Aquimarina sp.]